MLRIRGAWGFAELDDGVELASGRRRFMIKGDASRLTRLFSYIDAGSPEGCSLDELSRATGIRPPALETLLTSLKRAGVLTFDDLPIELPAFQRQVQFFDGVSDGTESGTILERRLRNSRVLLVGLGGYGTCVALFCARIGIKHIVAIDHDVVEASNLSRQVLYAPKDVGRKKAEAARSRLELIDEDAQFETCDQFIGSEEDLLPHLANTSLVLNGFGYLGGTLFETIARACIQAGVPSLAFGASWLGPLCVPGVTACVACLLVDEDRARQVRLSQGRARASGASPYGNFLPRIAITAACAVWEASRFLSGMDRAPSLDGLIVLDTLTYAHGQHIPVARRDDCELCGRP